MAFLHTETPPRTTVFLEIEKSEKENHVVNIIWGMHTQVTKDSPMTGDPIQSYMDSVGASDLCSMFSRHNL